MLLFPCKEKILINSTIFLDVVLVVGADITIVFGAQTGIKMSMIHH